MAPRRRNQRLLLLRVLVACAALFLSSGRPASFGFLADDIVVAFTPGDKAADSRAPAKVTRRAKAREALVPVSFTGALPASRPVNTTDALVLVRHRYLRHLALLC
jgi:hypothetical protein